MVSLARILTSVRNHYRKKSVPDHIKVSHFKSEDYEIVFTWLKRHKFNNYKEMETYGKQDCFQIEGVPIPFQDYVVDILCPTPPLSPNEIDEEKKKKYYKLKKFILQTMNNIMRELPESDKKIYMQNSPKAMMS